MKERIDILLVNLGFFDTRAKAQANIMANNVLVNDNPVTKPGTKVKTDSNIRIRKKLEYVSRGALKIKKAIEEFNIKAENKVCLDIGSSTGGFTEVLLKNGASYVYALDVGTNQLDYKLRINEKVKVMENTNARYVSKSDFDKDINLISIDVSFISLKLILPVAFDILGKNGGEIVALIKPQFEVGKEITGFNGVVKSKKYQFKAIRNIIDFSTEELKGNKLNVIDVTQSPVKGPKGNKEFFIYINSNENVEKIDLSDDYIYGVIL